MGGLFLFKRPLRVPMLGPRRKSEVVVIADAAESMSSVSDTPPEERLVEFVSELTGRPGSSVATAAPRLRRRPPTDPDRALGAVAEAIVALRHSPPTTLSA
jgi:hypothetical protein